MSIENKVVVITGASSGIGEATAKLLAQKGAKVVLGARREERLRSLVQEIQANGGQAVYRVTDVTVSADNQALVDLAKSEFGKVDVIFLNAGIMPSSPVSALAIDDWENTIDINLKGVMYGVAAVMPEFTKERSGQIITTSSIAGINSYPNAGIYGATKFAVRNLMEVIRMESAQEGTNIRTATLYPAAISTELLSSVTNEEALKFLNPLYDEFGITPDSIARVVAFAIDQPEDVNVSEFTIYPTKQG
ncbi:SDR family oxidoreductase [Paenibacillus sp. FSL H8-0079]|uniref:SDR family oxidoreductase n=1 Tax=Paenibacillus sp. FSL H8-0079 TaxID=2921375 RepID=UPI0030ED3021